MSVPPQTNSSGQFALNTTAFYARMKFANVFLRFSFSIPKELLASFLEWRFTAKYQGNIEVLKNYKSLVSYEVRKVFFY